MPKVSVIVPVYNVENYLKKCLDSIVTQTLTDIEIVCVDDGSTDSCPAILDEYTAKDRRVKVIHKINAGYGHAVNVGIDSAAGEYIGIVESDDYILPEMYATLCQFAEQYELDVVKSDHYRFWEKNNIYVRKHEGNIEYNQVLGSVERKNFFHTSIANWTGLYRKSFIANHQIRHNETPGASYQDVGFWIQTMSMVKRIMWVDQAFYMYRQDNPSQSIKNKVKMMDIHDEYKFVESILTEKGLYRELDYMNAFCLEMDKYAFYNRIGADLKKDFANIILKDYKKFSRFQYADDVVISDSVLQWYDKLTCNTNLVCRDAAEKLRFWDGIDKMIIYGAGRVAERAYMYLQDKGCISRLRAVAVSKKDSKVYFMHHEVKEITELLEYKEDLVIVAVKKGTQAYNDIIATLNYLGFDNYIDYPHDRFRDDFVE